MVAILVSFKMSAFQILDPIHNLDHLPLFNHSKSGHVQSSDPTVNYILKFLRNGDLMFWSQLLI